MPSGGTSKSSIHKTSAVSTSKLLLLGLVAVPSLGAQTLLEGTVARVVGGDTVPVPEVRVVLHRVDRSAQGPIDSVRANPAGRFRIRYQPDTSAIYILSTRHDGIEYFSSPLTGDGPIGDLTVIVSDTSSQAPVGIRARYLLVSAPTAEGMRELVDVFVLRNESRTTRVARDSMSPTWSFSVPAGRERTSIDEGTEVSQDAVTIRGDSVLVFAPIAPGSRQIVLTHFLSSKVRRLTIPFSSAVDSVTVLTEEPATRVTGGLREITQRIGQESLRGWVGTVGSGGGLSLTFPASPVDSEAALLVLVGVTGLAMILAFVMMLRRTRARASPGRDRLLQELATLDARYREKESETPAEEWQNYVTRRDALKRRLAEALSRGILLFGMFALSCGPVPPPPATGIHLLDDAGDHVSLPGPAVRVVSLIPSTTEILFAIGAGPYVVGRTTWCDWPAEALEVPSLGDGLRPSVELILDARPDLVLLYQSPQNALAAGRLRELGIPTVQLRVDRLEDLGRATRLLGTATAREHSADSLMKSVTRELEAARRSRPDSTDVLLLAWDQPPIVIGRRSFLHEVLTLAGGRNTFADLEAPSGPVSLESIVERNPSLIFTTSDTPEFADRPEWQVVEAVRARRFLSVSGSEFARPTPRAAQAVRQLSLVLDTLGGR